VLEVTLHTNGGTLVFNGHTHEQFVDLFHAIGSDPENRVVILTGAGQAFMESISPEGFDFFSPMGYDKIYREGRKVLMNILDVEVTPRAGKRGYGCPAKRRAADDSSPLRPRSRATSQKP
jgi:hypothetical protein